MHYNTKAVSLPVLINKHANRFLKRDILWVRFPMQTALINIRNLHRFMLKSNHLEILK